ncbi:MAG: hypothetical protein K0S91_1723 [Nitrososphaeraceae archaeon]|jgi:hypothetical protein|nr:hypothetical protein [Nitrososphaeraceae archaeon]
MIQERQIIKAIDKQIDVEDSECTKYAITSFHYLDSLLISVYVTIYRTVSEHKHETSYCITTATLRNRI